MNVDMENLSQNTINVVDSNLPSIVHPCDQEIEQVVAFITKELGLSVLIKAKEEFYWKFGKIFSDDPSYHIWMSYFLDYFIFEHKLQSTNNNFHGRTPFLAFKILNQPKSYLFNFNHSIFKVKSANNSQIYLKDLFSPIGYLANARADDTFEGIKKSDCIQGFIYQYCDLTPLDKLPINNQLSPCSADMILEKQSKIDKIARNANSIANIVLSRGVIFHHSSIEPIIKQISKRFINKTIDQSIGQILEKVASCQLKLSRLPNCNSKELYLNELKDFISIKSKNS